MSADADSSETVTLRYFAWVRERLGRTEEKIALPASVTNVQELISWMSSRGPEFENVFARPDVVRVAIDHAHVKSDASLRGAREIGFFPPVTGG